MRFDIAYSDANTAARILFAERQDRVFGFSLAYAGHVNPTFAGDAFTLPLNTFNIIRHENAVAGVAAITIQRADGFVGIDDANPDCRLRVGGAIASATLVLSAAGPTDNLDVSGVNTIFVNTAGNNVILGGTVGGVDGQILCVIVHEATNNFTLEHNEGTGNQDFILHAGADETMTAEHGGWVFVNDGGDHWHDCSHAKHV